MVCPDDCAVDHVGGAIPTGHLGQGLQHRIEHPGLHPAPVAPEDAVPLPIFIGQVTPLRSGPRDPHHPFKIGSIIARRSAAASSLRWQKRSDQCPFLIRNTDPFAQVCLPKSSLESIRNHPVKLCPRNLARDTKDWLHQSCFGNASTLSASQSNWIWSKPCARAKLIAARRSAGSLACVGSSTSRAGTNHP